MNTEERLKVSLEINENAKAYCRKVYGEDYTKNDLSIIRSAMLHGAKIVLDRVQENETRQPAKVFSLVRGGQKS